MGSCTANEKTERPLLREPWYTTSAWQRKTAVITSGTTRIRMDTDKGT